MNDKRRKLLAEAFRAYHEAPRYEGTLYQRIEGAFGGDGEAFRAYQERLVIIGGPHLPWESKNLSLYTSQASMALVKAGVTPATAQYAPYISMAYILHEVQRADAWSELLESLCAVPIGYLEAARVSRFGNSLCTYRFLCDVVSLWNDGLTEKYMAGLPLAFRLASSEKNGFMMEDALKIQETGIDPACAAAIHRHIHPHDYVEACGLLADVPAEYAVPLFEAGVDVLSIARMHADRLPLEYARAAA